MLIFSVNKHAKLQKKQQNHKKYLKKRLSKIMKKYNNPLPNLNILYRYLQATLTIPSKYSQKYNKSPPLTK